MEFDKEPWLERCHLDSRLKSSMHLVSFKFDEINAKLIKHYVFTLFPFFPSLSLSKFLREGWSIVFFFISIFAQTVVQEASIKFSFCFAGVTFFKFLFDISVVRTDSLSVSIVDRNRIIYLNKLAYHGKFY